MNHRRHPFSSMLLWWWWIRRQHHGTLLEIRSVSRFSPPSFLFFFSDRFRLLMEGGGSVYARSRKGEDKRDRRLPT